MKRSKLTLLAIAVVSPLIAYGAIILTVPNPVTPVSATTAGCPSGSYEIGYDDTYDKPICKLEPTGCPFGDSVPMDKCTPPPDITCNADWTKCEPKKVESEPTNVPAPTNDTRSTSGKEEQSSGCFSSK